MIRFFLAPRLPQFFTGLFTVYLLKTKFDNLLKWGKPIFTGKPVKIVLFLVYFWRPRCRKVSVFTKK